MIERPSTETENQMPDFNADLIDDLRANGGRASGGPLEGRRLAILTTTGAKSGTRRSTPLAYTRDGDRIVVVASMGGSPRHPAWYHNLRANPTVTVEVDGETFEASARITEDAERQRLYGQHADRHPVFLEYLTRTTRVIPVVVLERTTAVAA
jgi:deazaflavin-dependent oxidoreductase (nitroreductase family)